MALESSGNILDDIAPPVAKFGKLNLNGLITLLCKNTGSWHHYFFNVAYLNLLLQNQHNV